MVKRMVLAFVLLLGLPAVASAELPTVTITTVDPVAGEKPKDLGVFAVTRTGAVEAALTVYYAVEGSATPGEDYEALSGRVRIPAGESTALINVAPVADTKKEKVETVILIVSENPGYTVGPESVATVIIRD